MDLQQNTKIKEKKIKFRKQKLIINSSQVGLFAKKKNKNKNKNRKISCCFAGIIQHLCNNTQITIRKTTENSIYRTVQGKESSKCYIK